MIKVVINDEYEQLHSVKFAGMNRNTRLAIFGVECENLFDFLSIDAFLRLKENFLSRAITDSAYGMNDSSIKLYDDVKTPDKIIIQCKQYPNGQPISVTDYIICGITLENKIVIIKNPSKGDLIDMAIEREIILKMLSKETNSATD